MKNNYLFKKQNHKKKLYLLLFIAVIGLQSQAIAQDTNSSKRDFHFGIGLQPEYTIHKDFHDALIPHIQFSWDYRLAEVGPGRVTLGNYIGIAIHETKAILGFTDSEQVLYSLDLGLRLGYALNPLLNNKLEPYGGFQYSYHTVYNGDFGSQTLVGGDATAAELTYDSKVSIYAGARYNFSSKTGVYLELNPGYTLVKVGLVFKKF